MQCNAEPSEIRRETWSANAGASHENKIKSSQLGQETVATTANCIVSGRYFIYKLSSLQVFAQPFSELSRLHVYVYSYSYQ